MTWSINIIGAIIGLVLVAIYLWVALRVHKVKPDLSRIILLILSSVGFVTGIFLMCIAIAYDEAKLADLDPHRIPIIIGGIAIIYVSVEAFCLCYRKPK